MPPPAEEQKRTDLTGTERSLAGGIPSKGLGEGQYDAFRIGSAVHGVTLQGYNLLGLAHVHVENNAFAGEPGKTSASTGNVGKGVDRILRSTHHSKGQ